MYLKLKIYYKAKKYGLLRIKHIDNKSYLKFKDNNGADGFKVWLEINYPSEFDNYLIGVEE